MEFQWSRRSWGYVFARSFRVDAADYGFDGYMRPLERGNYVDLLWEEDKIIKLIGQNQTVSVGCVEWSGLLVLTKRGDH